MRVPLSCKVIFWLAWFVFFFPGLCIMLIHQIVPRVPKYMSLRSRVVVSLLALPMALVGLVPELWIESRRGN